MQHNTHLHPYFASIHSLGESRLVRFLMQNVNGVKFLWSGPFIKTFQCKIWPPTTSKRGGVWKRLVHLLLSRLPSDPWGSGWVIICMRERPRQNRLVRSNKMSLGIDSLWPASAHQALFYAQENYCMKSEWLDIIANPHAIPTLSN